jgi:prepilin-type N-terminal cleavage/methylation domain-containing protein
MKRAFSLVEMLVVVVVIAILAAFLLPRYLKGGMTPAGRKVEAPIQRAHGVECQNNLQQIRMAYQIATSAGEETRPQSLADLRAQGVTEQMIRCPVGREPYQFDPARGLVQCPHSGHEGY